MTTVFDAFPWPQFEESREAREGSEGKTKPSPPSHPSRDMITKIEQAEPVTALGVPKNYPDAKKLVTEDCIRPMNRNEANNQP